MRITHEGYIGIGTTTPSEKLVVNGNITSANNQDLYHLIFNGI